MAKKSKKSAAGYESCGCYIYLGRKIITCNEHLPADHPMKNTSPALPTNGAGGYFSPNLGRWVAL